MTPTTSLLLGAALGLAHAVAGVGIARLARGRADGPFTAIVLGGTAARLLLAATVAALVLVLTSVHTLAFMLGLAATFMVGLVAEVLTVTRRPQPAAPAA